MFSKTLGGESHLMQLMCRWLFLVRVKARLLLYFVVFGVVNDTQAVTFSSGLADAEWRVNASIFECTLSHPLATFGSAAFARRAGEAEIFHIQQKRLLFPAGNALIQAAQPNWQSDLPPQPLGAVTVAASNEAVRLDDVHAHQFQAVLTGGRRLMFLRPPETGRQAAVRVILEPIGFQQGFKAYRDCITQLLPVNFDQVRRTAVYFPADSETLAAGELRKLDVLIRYVKADSRINEIYIDGHTDSEGVRPENLEVSKLRAEKIANYLTERGISVDRLTTRWHGERYPVASNKTAQGRAQNRRVTVRLERKKA